MSLPLHRLPPLDALRGFVAVGRRMSITLAAQDLCLTQSAVSRQVLALEEALDTKLLVRGHRQVRFTPEGERLFRVADLALQQLQDLCGTLARRGAREPVTITASTGVTALWLLPRLGRLQQRHPEIDLRVAATNQSLDLQREGVDLAIRYIHDDTPPRGALRLFGESVVPVAHPSLGLAGRALREVLAEQVLLEFDAPQRPAQVGWARQLDALGPAAPRPRGMLRFNQYEQVVHAAVAGQGLALGRLPLVAPLLADGRLCALQPLATDLPEHAGCWLLQAQPEPRAEVRQVVDWILEEARGETDSHA
ncbi:LysR substrate-binding domain-containing protein [Caldimonas tepidiphila]|uniref:LysR substrate-binding domain-containing protein n=1 Tax=Caldimonas tepidiphila TaxID=2315841 RepID=UPI000E5B6722|nr:LysR substrate-binding domain-containing protein [Caldimonas tepidiphila]